MRYEVVIFGGGATGTATFRDLALRGFSVALLERRTIASGTTSASHQNLLGGLRYVLSDPIVAQECAEENAIISAIAPEVVGELRNYFVGFNIEYASRAEVARVFARDFGRSVYLAPLAERRRGLMEIDWIRDARVSRQWPNRIAVRIVERRPVAFVVLPRAAGGAASETALMDADGAILRLPPRARFSLPVLAGITRQQTPETRRARAGQVVDLIRQIPGYAGQISEIDTGDPDNLVVTEVVQNHAVRLLLGNRNYLSRLSNFMAHYPDIGRRLPQARIFDLRLDDRITARNGGNDGR